MIFITRNFDDIYKQDLIGKTSHFDNPIAITLTFEIGTTQEDCQKAWCHIRNNTARKLFKNDYSRRGKWLDCHAITACHFPDSRKETTVKRWHVHAIVNRPENTAFEELKRCLTKEFYRIPGAMTADIEEKFRAEEKIKKVDTGWTSYMCDQFKPYGMTLIDSII
jgi:hypothetical protein